MMWIRHRCVVHSSSGFSPQVSLDVPRQHFHNGIWELTLSLLRVFTLMHKRTFAHRSSYSVIQLGLRRAHGRKGSEIEIVGLAPKNGSVGGRGFFSLFVFA